MHLSDLAGKRILLVGYGKEGKATEAFLRARLEKPDISIVDQKDGPDYLKDQHEFDIAIKSPGVNPSVISIPYTTATNLFFSEARGKYKIVGVTGSKGKSTTSSLIHHVLQTAGKKSILAGNIGTPMLSTLSEDIDPETIFVLELSSYMLQDIQYSPNIGIITSLFPEHMDYHGSVEKYYEAKRNLVAFMNPEDSFVYNPQFPKLVEWAHHCHPELVDTGSIDSRLPARIAAQSTADGRGNDGLEGKDKYACRAVSYESLIDVSRISIPLIGDHNKQNMQGAQTVAHLLGISDEHIRSAFSTFQPLKHRLQFIGEYKNIKFIDDAIATTPEATIAAIHAVPNIGTIMLGGINRGYEFSGLIRELAEAHIPHVVLFPDSGKQIEEELSAQSEGLSYSPRITHANSMDEAVVAAYRFTSPGSVCLLSCASPSYSLWKNFEAKGDEFVRLVSERGVI